MTSLNFDITHIIAVLYEIIRKCTQLHMFVRVKVHSKAQILEVYKHYMKHSLLLAKQHTVSIFNLFPGHASNGTNRNHSSGGLANRLKPIAIM